MIDTTRPRQLALALMLATICGNLAHALPPLGLTQITPANSSAGLEIIDGTAYLNTTNGVWTVDSVGTKSFVAISHPTLGIPSSVTRVVKANDGELYIAANIFRPALYQVSMPSSPLVTWNTGFVRGVDAQLRAFGNVIIDNTTAASQFRLDGSIQSLFQPSKPNSEINIKYTKVDFVTPSGYAIGDSVIPGTAGSAPAQWTPEGDFSFVLGNGFATSSRDRSDGLGVNVGILDFDPTIRLGEDYY